MVGFIKKLFGGKSADSATAVRDDAVEYNGFKIEPAPQPEGSQWRLAGYIVRGSDDSAEERPFVRADLFSSREQAAEFAIRKGKQIIDEQGDKLFEERRT